MASRQEWEVPMQPHDKTPDHHVAFGAATDGFAAAMASLAVVGRYWWNMQMRLLIATGVMRFFKAHWWLFVVVGFALLAFALPLGVAFIVSAFCAGEMNPKAEDDYLVPLKAENDAASADTPEEQSVDFGEADRSGVIDDVLNAAGLHHVGYLRAVGLDVRRARRDVAGVQGQAIRSRHAHDELSIHRKPTQATWPHGAGRRGAYCRYHIDGDFF